MEATSVKAPDMYKGLRDKFLFSNDINSIYILLALYDIEENISNISPSYMSKSDIKRKIKHVLGNREDKEIISHNLSAVIHEDINRLELCFCLEGYKHGFNNKKWTNIIENKALELYGFENLYQKTHLFHFNTPNKALSDLRKKCKKELDYKERKDRYIESLVYTFSNKIIKKKIIELDKYIDKQMRMDFEFYDIKIGEENYNLRDEEIDKIYLSIVNSLNKKMKMIYKEAFWYAINDKVLGMYC